MQHPVSFLFIPLGACLCAVLASGAHRASAQPPTHYLATYEFNAYYADQVEASPSDLDVSPHQLTNADDATADDGNPARPAPKSRLSRKQYRLTNGCTPRCPHRSCYADAQLNFLRTNLASEVDSTTSSDQLELSPRVVLGTRNCNQCGARAQYQHYDWHTASTTSPTSPGVQFEFQSLDLEVTKRLFAYHTNLDLAAGVRLAKVQEAKFEAHSTASLMGGTVSANARTRLCSPTCWSWSWVYGGRLSLLGGHWNGSAHQGNGNVFVSEVFTGVETRCCRYSHDLFARFLFEVQNWHSDAFLLSDNVTLMGPGVQLGVRF